MIPVLPLERPGGIRLRRQSFPVWFVPYRYGKVHLIFMFRSVTPRTIGYVTNSSIWIIALKIYRILLSASTHHTAHYVGCLRPAIFGRCPIPHDSETISDRRCWRHTGQHFAHPHLQQRQTAERPWLTRITRFHNFGTENARYGIRVLFGYRCVTVWSVRI